MSWAQRLAEVAEEQAELDRTAKAQQLTETCALYKSLLFDVVIKMSFMDAWGYGLQ